jgi:hypothetical protein
MFTEEDLRATLGALESDAPDADRVLAGLDRRRRRRTVRRRTLGTVAAAVLAAVVTGGAVLVASPGQSADPAASPLHLERLRFPFVVGDIPGYQVVLGDLNVGNLVGAATIDKPENFVTGDAHPYVLTVYEKGILDPSLQTGGEPVHVNGKAGFYSDGMTCQCGEVPGTGAAATPGVVWEYAPDSWAKVRYQPISELTPTSPPADAREVVLDIAAAVDFDRTTPWRVPFQVGYLPAGLRPAGTNTGDSNTSAGEFTVSVSLEAPGRRTLIIDGVESDDSVTPGGPVVVSHSGGGTEMVIDFGRSAVRLVSTGYSTEQLEKVARSVTPAEDLHDPSTWFDATRALAWR